MIVGIATLCQSPLALSNPLAVGPAAAVTLFEKRVASAVGSSRGGWFGIRRKKGDRTPEQPDARPPRPTAATQPNEPNETQYRHPQNAPAGQAPPPSKPDRPAPAAGRQTHRARKQTRKNDRDGDDRRSDPTTPPPAHDRPTYQPTHARTTPHERTRSSSRHDTPPRENKHRPTKQPPDASLAHPGARCPSIQSNSSPRLPWFGCETRPTSRAEAHCKVGRRAQPTIRTQPR